MRCSKAQCQNCFLGNHCPHLLHDIAMAAAGIRDQLKHLKQEARNWEAIARSCIQAHDKLKEKYEPEELTP